MSHFPVVPAAVIQGFVDTPAGIAADLGAEFALDEHQAMMAAATLAKALRWDQYDGAQGAVGYSRADRDYIHGEYGAIWERLSAGIAPADKDAAPKIRATFGSPGAGKTTLLADYVAERPDALYLDPDERVLMNMTAYRATIEQAGNALTDNRILQDLLPDTDPRHFGRMVSCARWRGASNYLQNSFMNAAVAGRYNIAFGTTATGAGVRFMYLANDPAKDVRGFIPQGYQASFMVVDAPVEVKSEDNARRWKEGSGKFVPKRDLVGKAGLMADNFPLIPQLVAQSGGMLEYFWRPVAGAPADRVACFYKDSKSLSDYQRFDAMCQANGSNAEEIVQIYRDALSAAEQAPARPAPRRSGPAAKL